MVGSFVLPVRHLMRWIIKAVSIVMLVFYGWGSVWALEPITINPPTAKETIIPNVVLPDEIVTAVQPRISMVLPATCVRQDSPVTIEGTHFADSHGKTVAIVKQSAPGGGNHFDLMVQAWTDSKIIAVIPDSTGIERGERYIIGIEKSDHSGWVSNIDKIITMCPAASLESGSGSINTNISLTRTPTGSLVPKPEPPIDEETNHPDTVTSEPDIETAPGQGSMDTSPVPIASGSLMNQGLPPAPATAKVEHDPPNTLEPGEITAFSDDMVQAQDLARQMASRGIKVIRRRKMTALGLVVSVFRVPKDTIVTNMVTSLTKAFPDVVLDANHLYHLQGGHPGKLYAAGMIGWQVTASCGSGLKIGVIDTGIDLQHPALREKKITTESFVTVGFKPADNDHGTAIAALLVGDDGKDIHGLIPAAQLYVAEVFRNKHKHESDTTVEWLISGLDWLLSQHVALINMSLGGPSNRLLEVAVKRVMEQGVPVIAAAGNNGSHGPAVYPAAQQGVVAVTAVDADARSYSHANHGQYIRYAAPGVDVISAGKHGARYFSGTSFATPFVTATLAVTRSLNPAMSLPDALKFLDAKTKDLGDPGRDPVYGVGLIQTDGRCNQGV